MKHLLILTTVVVTGLIAIRLLEPISYAHWIGGFTLKVTLVGDTQTPIESINAYELQNDLELGWFQGDTLEGDGSPISVILNPDKTFDVRLTTMGKTSNTGRELSYHQPQYLGVVLTFEDGTSRRLWVELPDGREKQEVKVPITLTSPD